MALAKLALLLPPGPARLVRPMITPNVAPVIGVMAQIPPVSRRPPAMVITALVIVPTVIVVPATIEPLERPTNVLPVRRVIRQEEIV